MSITYPATLKCSLCGKESEQTIVGSTSALGPPDLDGRPSELARSTIGHWVQTCPSCGYSFPAISTKLPRTQAAVLLDLTRSQAYRQQLNDTALPRLANAFLCLSQILEKAGEPLIERSRPYICAAWACDDAGNEAGALECRKQASELLMQAREGGERFSDEAGEDDAVLVDLLRRSRQFTTALSICDDALGRLAGGDAAKVLQFQKRLSERGDTACHNLAEVL